MLALAVRYFMHPLLLCINFIKKKNSLLKGCLKTDQKKTRTADTAWMTNHRLTYVSYRFQMEISKLANFLQLPTCLKPAVVIEEETHADDTGSLLGVKAHQWHHWIHQWGHYKQYLNYQFYLIILLQTLLCLAPPTLQIIIHSSLRLSIV